MRTCWRDAAREGWLKQLGSDQADIGNAVFERTTAGTCGPSLPPSACTPSADALAEAVELAKGYPILKEGGGVEVGVLTPAPRREHAAQIL
jgi:hypothetical protein